MQNNKFIRTTIEQVRPIDFAKELLKNTEKTIPEIEKETGCSYAAIRYWSIKLRGETAHLQVETLKRRNIVVKTPKKNNRTNKSKEKVENTTIAKPATPELVVEKAVSEKAVEKPVSEKPMLEQNSDINWLFKKENVSIDELISELDKASQFFKATGKKTASFSLRIKG